MSFEKISEYIMTYGFNILMAILIFIIGKWIAQIIARLIERAIVTTKNNRTLASFAKNLSFYTMMIFIFIAALNKLGFQTASFVAVLGAASLAIGLALQGSLSNFAAGVMIILFQPFGVGDTIEAAGTIGKVDEIQIFSTIVMTNDNKKVIIPNSKVTADKIIVHLNANS